MNLRSLSLIPLASCLLLTQCSHYAGTKSQTSAASVGYGTNYRTITIERPNTDPDLHGAPLISMAAVPAVVVGYLFTQADKAITKARTGDYGHPNVALTNTRNFPEGGYLVIVRTIQDPKNEFPGIAGTQDFLSRKEGTPGESLNQQIVKKAKISGGGTALSKVVADALNNAPDGKEIQPTDKIALLAVCPVIKLDNRPSGSDAIYGVGFSGVYFPILSASRFGAEAGTLSKRVTSSRESLVVDVHGPNGSGYTTGQIIVPLVWNPPYKGRSEAEWLTSEDIMGKLISKEQLKELERLVLKDARKRLANGDAFVAPRSGVRPLLHAGFRVSETSDATKWISKGIKKLGGAAKGAVDGGS